jgi:hypothetical protein
VICVSTLLVAALMHEPLHGERFFGAGVDAQINFCWRC